MLKDFSIRTATIDDIQNIFDLSNDKDVRENSINKKEISWKEHKTWFENRINQADSLFYVVENKEKELVAQVKIDKKEETVISISILKKFRGCGLASQIIEECVKKSKFEEVVAYVKINNIPSYKAFKGANFLEREKVNILNEPYYKLIFTSNKY